MVVYQLVYERTYLMLLFWCGNSVEDEVRWRQLTHPVVAQQSLTTACKHAMGIMPYNQSRGVILSTPKKPFWAICHGVLATRLALGIWSCWIGIIIVLYTIKTAMHHKYWEQAYI